MIARDVFQRSCLEKCVCGRRRVGTCRALEHAGSLRRLLVFSWGHRTQRRMKSAAKLKPSAPNVPGSTDGSVDGGNRCGRDLKPSQNPLYGFWRCRMVARFLFSALFSPCRPCRAAELPG